MSPSKRLKLLLPAVPALIAAVILFLVGASRNELACDRAGGACTYRDGILGDGRTFPITDVREFRFSGDHGKGGADGEVALIFTNGDDERFGYADEDEAKATYERARGFLAGQGSVYRYQRAARTWMHVLAAGMLLGSLGMMVSALRAKPEVLTDAAARRKHNNRFATFACIVCTLMIGGTITTCVTNKNPGTLVLDCQAGCKVGGTACEAGTKREMTLDSGTHTIEMSGAEQKVVIADGETTSFVCQ